MMRHTRSVMLFAIIAAGCGQHREATPSAGAGRLRSECYSVSLLPDTQLTAIDLDASGRILVVYPSNVIDYAFVWDGTRHDLQNPINGGTFGVYASEMNDHGEVVGFVGTKKEDGGPIEDRAIVVWRAGVPTVIAPPLESVTPSDARALPKPRINELGHVAGTFLHRDGSLHAFLARGGASTDLGPGTARDLDDADDVVGDSGGRAVMWKAGAKIDLGVASPPPPFESLWAERHVMRINDRMQVALSPTGASHPWLWSNGTLTSLGTVEGVVRAINDRGDVVGFTDQAVLWRGDAVVGLGGGGGLNERGQVTGWEASTNTPYVLDGTTRIALPLPPGDLGFVGATLINDAGVVVGPAGESYHERVVVWTPDQCPNGEPPDAGPPPPPEEPPE